MSAPGETSRFLNRFVLPKVALGCIAAASLLGVMLTMSTHGAPAWLGLARWAHLMALGLLAGGAMWLGGFVRRPDDAADVIPVARFVTAARRRFRPLLVVALGLGALSAWPLVWLALRACNAGQRPAGLAALLLTGAALVLGAALLLESPSADPFRVTRARAAFVAATLALLATALLDARLTFPGSALAVVLRPIHVAAFGLWLGGAVWNIFVVVPSAQETLALPVVVAAAQQLERFRWAVRVILPALVLTGLAQAVPYTGWSAGALVTTPLGVVILGKLLLVAGLLTIFVTCPMWRGCSPIRGMCDLDDLEEAERRREPTRTLDHRGRGCGGFVHVREALAELVPGEVLELLSSDRISWEELPRWLARRRYTLLVRERHGRLWWRSYRYLIEKPGKETIDESREEVPGSVQARA